MLIDKKNIEESIVELDQLKNKTLFETFNTVNQNFQNIFSTMLPGAMAELEKVDPEDIAQGVKIKVGFNNSWKDGLSELSGG